MDESFFVISYQAMDAVVGHLIILAIGTRAKLAADRRNLRSQEADATRHVYRTIKYYDVNGIKMDDLDLMQYKNRCEVAALRRLDDALEEQRRQRDVTRTLTPCTQDELGTAGDAYGFVQNGRGLISMAPQTWLNGEALCRILCDEIRQLNTALQPEERTAVADPQFWEYRFTEHYRNYEEYEATLRQNVTHGISLHMHGDTVAFGRL
ncbi:hypothetical protein QR680_014703 [Steinernema hermaphroditum]|uniref:Uncharacterized protein n=1 Tax=Steinernema hermaphroditum TaxID=289476 RepID=A0AA39I9W6_9BILA|nr:hypothetical protein QR680_014703 [Steinernema hermaphroditum]